MSLLPPTRALLVFLNRNPDVRAQIAALPDATLLYAGRLMQPAWKEIEAWREQLPQLKTKRTLPDVLQAIRLTGQPHPNLLAWAQSLDTLVPWKHNGFIGWRALSGIFASNAKGSVSFVVGSGVSRDEKVFAATEVSVLLRNPHVDEITRDLLAYYQRCLQAGRSDLCVSYVSA